MNNRFAGSKFMLFLLIWYVVIVILLQFTLIALHEAAGVNTDALVSSPWFIIVLQLISLMLPMAIWMIIKREKLSLPTTALGGKNFILIIALSFLMQPVMMTIAGISTMFTTNYVSEMIYRFMAYPFIFILLATAVTPAIVEELVFRGYMQQAQYQGGGSFKKIALLNGLFFGIIHLNLNQFVYAFVMGVVFAYMVHYTRSIWAGILSHFIVNASQGAIGRWAFSAQENAYYTEDIFYNLPISTEALAIIIFGIISICLLPVIIILFREFFKHNEWRVDIITPVSDSKQDDYMHGYSGFSSGQDDTTYVAHQNFSQMPPPTKPSKIDPYAIAVVIIFIIIVVLFAFIPS